MDAAKAFDLLSLVGGEGDASSDVAKKRLLTATLLQSRTSLWKHKISDLYDLLTGTHDSHLESRAWAFPLFAEAVQRSSDAELKENCSKWTGGLVRCLQASKCVSTVQEVCSALSAVLDRVHRSKDAVRDFATTQLPMLVQGLLWFNGSHPCLQCAALKVVAKCLVHFTAATLQFKSELRKWAQSCLFSEQLPLSQECGRLLVLLCLNNSSQWNSLTQDLTSALHWILTNIYHPVLGNQAPPHVPSSIELPPLPVDEPRRSSLLVVELAALSRTFCYALMFPPEQPSPSVSMAAPGIDLERVLGVAMFGLSVQHRQVSGHTTEKLLLGVILPVVHTAVWNIVLALVRACGSHLLPYAAHIESNLVMGMSDTSHDLKSDIVSPPLIMAIHRALVAWVKLRKDFEPSFLAPVTKSLIQFCLLTPSTKDHVEVRLSGLKSLCSLVETSGPILPHSVAVLVSRLPLDSLSPSLPTQETLMLLELLLTCVTSGNSALSLPLSSAIQIFNEHRLSSSNQQVVDLCRSALSQCGLLQHPAVVPLPPPPSKLQPSAESSSQPPSVHPSISMVPPSHYLGSVAAADRRSSFPLQQMAATATPPPSSQFGGTPTQGVGTPMETCPSIGQPSVGKPLPNETGTTSLSPHQPQRELTVTGGPRSNVLTDKDRISGGDKLPAKPGRAEIAVTSTSKSAPSRSEVEGTRSEAGGIRSEAGGNRSEAGGTRSEAGGTHSKAGGTRDSEDVIVIEDTITSESPSSSSRVPATSATDTTALTTNSRPQRELPTGGHNERGRLMARLTAQTGSPGTVSTKSVGSTDQACFSGSLKKSSRLSTTQTGSSRVFESDFIPIDDSDSDSDIDAELALFVDKSPDPPVQGRSEVMEH